MLLIIKLSCPKLSNNLAQKQFIQNQYKHSYKPLICLLNIQTIGVVSFKGSHPKILLVGSEACVLSLKVTWASFKKP